MFRSESTARLLDGDEFSCLKIADRESEGKSSEIYFRNFVLSSTHLVQSEFEKNNSNNLIRNI